ncbi:uncharacterized protein LOC142974103 [Anticarsia gemmatalis]|uniref:uncharacterized protein LOC142974103 n=1 Tax=Anticarsia gemmatalis TaxID=129554 RepID=UPI003F76E857
MNTSVEGIIVNNCQYAPIYLIQDPSAAQVNTYVLTPSNGDQPKPISNNLKTFYENSGNIENGLVNVDGTGHPAPSAHAARPVAVKKKESVLLGHNLKLASFLLPKNENVNKQYVGDNIVLKAHTSSSNPAPPPPPAPVTVNTLPKIDMDRKIVKLKEVPIINRHRFDKVLPKTKPKDNAPSPNQSKHTSVQLIKLGETYHSLNHLSEEQIKMVNQALKMFKDPDKTTPEPTYDPVTNTRYIYKVVSPKDLTVVGQKKFLMKDKKVTKIPKKLVEEKIIKQVIPVKEEPPEPEPPAEAKVTRSGRKVKLPKQILTEDLPHKSKKKTGTIISCFQCSAEFSSLYRLQKHYENHPTHIPAKIHSNLFHCLLAIIKSGSEGNKTNIFIQQLEQLIVKLKSLLPCLLKKVDGSEGHSCTINDDIGRLFGMNPGKYNIDVEALNCVKDKNGYCIHNPPKLNQYIKDNNTSSTCNNSEAMEPDNETENCARINSVAKWPTVSKRIWKLKQKTNELSAKKMRLKSEGDTLIDLGTEELIFNSVENTCTAAHPASSASSASSASAVAAVAQDEVAELLGSPCSVTSPAEGSHTNNVTMLEPTKPKTNYVQFHSAHFDIRSSPIKSSSTVFRKFQINPDNYQVKVLRTLEMVDKDHGKRVQQATTCSDNTQVPMSSCDDTLHSEHLCVNVAMSAARSTLTNSNNAIHVALPTATNGLHGTSSDSNNVLLGTLTNTSNSLHDTLASTSSDDLHAALAASNSALCGLSDPGDSIHVSLASSDNSLHVPLPNSENSLDLPIASTENSLHDIFKDDVDLACKEDSNIDPELKDWIISTSEKSQDSFTKSSSSLIEPGFLHVQHSVDKCPDKSVHHNDMPTLDASDTRLLSNQGESVLNFLETLGNDLAYPETEIRNSGVDFQLDLFTFHHS